MQATITVEAKVLGWKRLVPDWEIPFPADTDNGGRILLRDLIARIVREEVRAFQERQGQRKLLRVLTPAEIAQGVEGGKVDAGGRDLQQKVDPDQAIGTALQAFVDGIYFVLVDGEQQQSLDQEVLLKPDSHLTFLRLTPLAGG